MGVTNETWAWFKKYLPEDRTTKICELGDQQFMACPPFPEFSWVGEYLKSIGNNGAILAKRHTYTKRFERLNEIISND